MRALLPIFLLLLFSCSGPAYSPSSYRHDFGGLMDTLLPRFARLHDSIPESGRYLPAYRSYMEAHKRERKYEWLYYHESTEGWSYFMITRLEPSMRNDKFSAVCGRFRRDAGAGFDSASYEELFWTWKMRKEELHEKSSVLFGQAVKGGDLKKYMPENSDGEWIEFPGNGTRWDRNSGRWVKE